MIKDICLAKMISIFIKTHTLRWRRLQNTSSNPDVQLVGYSAQKNTADDTRFFIFPSLSNPFQVNH